MSWSKVGSQIDGTDEGDNLGTRCAISDDGTVIAFTARYADGSGNNSTSAGEGYVYAFVDGAWTRRGTTLFISGASDQLFSVALSGDGSRVAFGHRLSGSHDGRVDVWDWSGSSWSRVGGMGDMVGSDSGQFGISLAFNTAGSRIVVGEINFGSGNKGRIAAFELISNTWTQMGNRKTGGTNGDQFGRFVAINGSGNKMIGGGAGNEGTAKAFSWDGSSWTRMGSELTGSTDSFGVSVSMDSSGDRIAISSKTGGTNSKGYTKIYDYDSGLDSWSLDATINALSTDLSNERAVSLNYDGDVIAISNTGNTGSGNVRVYQRSAGTWTKVGNDITGSDDAAFGFSVNLSKTTGEYVVIGAAKGDVGASGTGSVFVYQNTSLSESTEGGSFTVSGNGSFIVTGSGQFIASSY